MARVGARRVARAKTTSGIGGNSSILNVIGVVITPVLAALLIGSQVHITPESILGIIGQLVVPFVAGQLLHRRIGNWLGRHRILVSIVDQGSVLLVVYVAFSTGVTQGLWTVVPPAQLLTVVGVSVVLLAVVMSLFAGAGKVFRLPRADRIVLFFCGSKKSQVSRLPMTFLLFPAMEVGIMVLPLMVFHLTQLLVCAVIALAIAAMVLTGYRMWWKRRPTRGGLPSLLDTTTGHQCFVYAIALAAALGVGLFMPLLGISLAVFVVVDILLAFRARREAPPTARTTPAGAGTTLD